MRAAVVWGLALILAGWFAAAMLGRLDTARTARDRIAGQAVAMRLDLPAAAALAAGDADSARRRLADLVADRGSAAGVRLSTAPDGHAPSPGLVRLNIVARGGEIAVRRFALALEAGPPAVRLARWRIAAEAGGVRLEADAIAPWRPR